MQQGRLHLYLLYVMAALLVMLGYSGAGTPPVMPTSTGRAIAALILLLVGAPIIPGIASRTKAILTGRRGSPVWQLYADLRKLARRGIVYSTTTTLVFQLAPIIVLATTIIAAMLVPLDGRDSVLRFAGDAVAFGGLLALGRFVLVLAALDTGSSFEGMGASRDVTFASLIEPGLFIALATLGRDRARLFAERNAR